MSFQVPVLTGNSSWSCRDEFIGSTYYGPNACQRMKVLYDKKTNSYPGSGNNWSIQFPNYSGSRPTQRHDVDRFGRAIWMAAKGSTNREFSPLASPFTLRWMIGVLRAYLYQNPPSFTTRVENLPSRLTIKACREYVKTELKNLQNVDSGRSKKIYDLMLLADENKIRMQSDISVAWGFDRSMLLDHMNLTGLLYCDKALKPAYNYNLVFPPSILMSEIRKGSA